MLSSLPLAFLMMRKIALPIAQGTITFSFFLSFPPCIHSVIYSTCYTSLQFPKYTLFALSYSDAAPLSKVQLSCLKLKAPLTVHFLKVIATLLYLVLTLKYSLWQLSLIFLHISRSHAYVFIPTVAICLVLVFNYTFQGRQHAIKRQASFQNALTFFYFFPFSWTIILFHSRVKPLLYTALFYPSHCCPKSMSS